MFLVRQNLYQSPRFETIIPFGQASMKQKPFSISKHLPVIFLLVFLSFFAHLGNIPLFDTDEGAYSEVTREMLVNQDFTAALLNGIPFFHKPPLFYWAQAASIKILGLNELGLRLPSAIGAFLWTASIFLFTRRCYDTRTAWHAALFMGSSVLITLTGRAATAEAMVNLFLTLTLINIYRFYHTGSKRHIYWSFMFGALGVLTKGAIALFLPVFVSLSFFGIKKKWPELRALFLNPVGLLVFGLIVMPWYLGEFMLHGEAFLSDLLMLPGMSAINSKLIGGTLPYYSYPAFIFAGLLPFSGLVLKVFWQIRKLFADDLVKFLFLWLFFALLFLPLVQPQSIFSISYSFPPLLILMARVAVTSRYSLFLLLWPLFFLLVLLLVPFATPYISGSVDNEFFRNIISETIVYFDQFYRLTLVAVILLLLILLFIRPVPDSVKYSVLGLLFVSLINFLVLPIAGSILQQPVKSAALLAKNRNLSVITWKIHQPSFNVYAERLTEIRAPQPGDIVLTRSVFLGNGGKYETLFEKHGIVLVKMPRIPEGNLSE